ncbi:MAG: hypothetical protein INF65_12660 [Roseomonas sp.]|nr:hypothetical protein [Roseomonas sp.]MCA3389472.1 hypothetical protein [Roseomonas sp.]MCA3392389.1 hypothetical protein [Roseomonas sp.]MCA3406586.1 hypothetical protein [Roseomonas sp.]
MLISDLSQLQRTVLVAIYKCLDLEDEIFFSTRQVHVQIVPRLPMGVVAATLVALMESELIYQSDYSESVGPEKKFALTAFGAEISHEAAADYTATVASGKTADLDHIISARLNALDEQSSDSWHPIQADSSSDLGKDAIDSIQTVLDRVEADNGFAATSPRERDTIVYSLKVGIEILRSHLPSREQVTAFVLSPLKYIIRVFGQHATGELAKRAVEKVLSWLSES